MAAPKEKQPDPINVHLDYGATPTGRRPAPTNCPNCNHSVTPLSTGNDGEVECPGCGHRWDYS